MDNNEEFVKMFSEFLTIYKFVNRKQITERLVEELNNETLVKIYQLTDGNNSTRTISEKIGKKFNHVTIARYWKQWALKGIVMPADTKGRYKAAFNLDEYGLSLELEEEDDGK